MPAEEAPEAALEGRNEIFLIVEEDDLVRTYVTSQLKSFSYNPIPHTGAAEALATVDSGAPFDLLLTDDVVMPGALNGRQLADEVAERRSPLKVLFTSG